MVKYKRYVVDDEGEEQERCFLIVLGFMIRLSPWLVGLESVGSDLGVGRMSWRIRRFNLVNGRTIRLDWRFEGLELLLMLFLSLLPMIP